MNQISENINGGMAAVLGMDSKLIIELLKEIKGVVEAVNFNEPKQTVIAGEKQALENASKLLKEKGARRVVILEVSGPFHSSLMKPAAEKLLVAITEIDKAKAKGIFHKNTASRKISRLTKLVNSME
jgi:[acyl-carrier-protein] S-malonyltransferase